jgi:hypothetical protein
MTEDYCKVLLLGFIPKCYECVQPKEGKCTGFSFDADGHAYDCNKYKVVLDEEFRFWHKL